MKPSILMIAGLAAIAMSLPMATSAQRMPGGAPSVDTPHEWQGLVNPPSGPDDAQITRRPQGIDVEFVDRASLAGKREVQASQIALERSPSADVRAYARRMVDDHGKTNDQLRRLGAQKGVPVQAARIVDPDVDALRSKSGREFDTAYVAVAGPDAHREAIRLFDAEARNGHDPDLRAFAGRTLPTLEHHLAAAHKVARKVEGQ